MSHDSANGQGSGLAWHQVFLRSDIFPQQMQEMHQQHVKTADRNRRSRRPPQLQTPAATLTQTSSVVDVTVGRREAEEKQRVVAAKAALAAKLVGYESSFPQSAGDDQKSAEELAAGVVSAKHIPVPTGKVQAMANVAVVLLLNGQPVQSLQRDRLTYLPVQLIDGAAADSFEVVMEAPTLLYRTNAEARQRKEQQISDAVKRIADAQSTLAELRQALTRSEATLAEVAQSPSATTELGDIGAMAVEQQRIQNEISRQQGICQAQNPRLKELLKLADSQLQLTAHRITPRFHLQSGLHEVAGPEQVLQVGRKLQRVSQVQVQFSHSVADAK